MRNKKQQSQKQRLRSWFQKNSTSELRYLARNSQRGYLQGKSVIMLSI